MNDWRCSATSATALTYPGSRTNPRPRTNPAVARAGAKPLPLTGDADLGLRIVVALLLGLALGTEREIHGHPAGMRTMALIAAGIVTGVGFLGAGSILRQGEEVRGLTTVASIWVVAALGMAVGFGFYPIAIFTTLLVVVTLVAIRPLENRFFRNSRTRRRTDPHRDEHP